MANSVGQPLERIDGRLKVSGRATYAAEHQIPDLAHAVMVTSAVAKGRIAAIDVHGAEHTPGVLAVLTHLTMPKLSKEPAGAESGKPADRKLQLLQDDKVLFANQPVALVVATTLEAATEGAERLSITYDTAPHRISLQQGAGEAYAPPKAGPGGDPTDSTRGDVEAGLASAVQRLDQVYRTPFETHNPMEPHATIAVWDTPDSLTLYDATQGVFTARERVATVLGLAPDHVRIISPFLGGGFGCKGPVWSHVLLAAMAAKYVRRPVKLVLTRPQMFGPVGFRAETQQTVRGGVAADGTLVAFEHKTLTHTSEFDQFLETASLPARMLYACPNVATAHRLVRSTIGTPSYMRAPGEAPGNVGVECAMDELAYAAKMDPIAFRLKNYAERDPDKNLPWSSKSLRECYRLGAERFGWSRRSPQPRSMREGDTLIGLGMATACYPTRRSAASAKARILADGTVQVEAGTQDLGTGTYTIMTQLAADALGVPPDRVTFRLGDTAFPETPVSGGSQTAASTGSAVHAAASALRQKLHDLAATGDAPSSPHGDSYQALLARHGLTQLEAEATSAPGDEKKQYAMYGFGAQFAEVHVDADLGQIRIARLTGVFGTGRILNARTARSQFLGGMVFGVGMALYERTIYDEHLGRIVNNNLAEYHLPVNADIGAIDVAWVDEQEPHANPIGAKGIGEIGTTGVVAAIANAVYHATGTRVRELPITLDRLL